MTLTRLSRNYGAAAGVIANVGIDKTKRQKDKKTKRQKDKKTKRQKDKRQRPKREFTIATSGQFRTLAMFKNLILTGLGALLPLFPLLGPFGPGNWI